MSLEELTSKYIASAEKVLKELQHTKAAIQISEQKTAEVLRWAEDYLEDARYYKSAGKLETSLTSVAYCEGLLDALRLLGAVKFEWPTNRKTEKSC